MPRSILPILILSAALTGCTIVSQADQRADAARQAAAQGKILADKPCLHPGPMGTAELNWCATDGTQYSVTNIILGR